MSSENASAIRVDVRVAQGTDGLKVTMTCSDRRAVVPLSRLLSALRSFTNAVVDAAVEREQAAGREISCKAGCGACCRQLVPLSATEAQQMSPLIDSLTDAHRSRVRAKFDQAIARLRTSTVWDRLERYATLSQHERLALKTDYFRLGIACPFLEDESCSIHPVRPLICRQYLVTSPANHCNNPSAESITRVVLAADVVGALKRIETREQNALRSVPLVLAPILNLGKSESKRTVPDWMSLLLGQIKRIRDEQIGASKQKKPTDLD